MGLFASGYPQHGLKTSLGGQLLGMLIMVALGFIPGYLLSLILKLANQLRVSREDELKGLDIAELCIKGVTPAGELTLAND